MLNIILAGARSETTDELEKGIQQCGYQIISKVNLNVNLASLLEQHTIDAIIINVEIPDQYILDQMKNINAVKPIPIIMFSEKANDDAIEAVVNAGVSAYVVNGLSRTRVKSIVDTAIVRFRTVKATQDELKKAKNSLNERKQIDRAKGMIMRHSKIGEEEAYKTLRKMAMDSNKRIAKMAEDIVNVFKGLP